MEWWFWLCVGFMVCLVFGIIGHCLEHYYRTNREYLILEVMARVEQNLRSRERAKELSNERG